MVAPLRAFVRLGTIDKHLLVEVMLLLALVRASIVLLRFTTLRGAVSRYVRIFGTRTSERRVNPARVAWAVKAVTRRLPFRTSCLVEGVVADAVLRRRGAAAVLRLGVRRPDRVPLEAHAWVECEGEVVIGGVDRLTDYAVLAPQS
jgi:hypothetical protein